MLSHCNPPLVSVLTPTWNRANYLDRLWSGLNNQTYKNIEWIVCDDGSVDNTALKLFELREKSTFPVIIISATCHIGKSRMDNVAVASARGEFILWNDSDDYLLPKAIERLVTTWRSIPDGDRNEFVGVTALCGNERGVISTELPVEGVFDTTWNALRFKDEVAGDMLYFIRSKLLKENPFPEVDFLIPEGVVWTLIGNSKTRVIPEILKVVQYGAPNCISFSDKMEYCRGKAYAMAILRKNLENFPKRLNSQFWDLTTFLRYSIHGELDSSNILRLWGKKSVIQFYIIAMPLALILAFKDIIQGKVKKTHRDFEIACRSVNVNVDNGRK